VQGVSARRHAGVGEPTVVIAGAGHRDQGFQAARYGIDRLKKSPV
jgi:molybdopterin synthase catalytic subunit